MTQPYLLHLDDQPLEGWDDPVRGRMRWKTLVCADQHASSSLTAGVLMIEPGDQLLPHRHRQAEAYFILTGEGVVTLEDQQLPVRAQDGVFVPGGALHGIRNTGGELLSLYYCFAADRFSEIEYLFDDGR